MSRGARRSVLLGGLALLGLGCSDPAAPPSEVGTGSSGTDGGSDETTGVPDDEPLPPRPETQSCRFDGWAPGLLPPLVFEPDAELPALPGARTLVAELPSTLLVGTDDGRVLALDLGAPEPVPIEVRAADGETITGLAIDGDGSTTHLFVRSEATSPARTRVVRATLSSATTIEPGSTVEVIAIPHDPDTRHGHGLAIADGELWIPVGDGSDGDGAGPADDPFDRAGSLLRLDVSALVGSHDYQVPPDNPVVDGPGDSPEAWAWGLRDPAGCSLDLARGRVWCADTGASVSEASLVEAGVDLGWPRIEGADCLLFGGCENLGTRLPAATARHEGDDCGTGAAAVADGLDPDLDGALVFADRCSGRAYAVRPSEPGRAGARGIVGDLERGVLALAPDPAGGLWMLDDEGQLGRVVVERPPGHFPLSLAESGCFPEPGLRAPDVVPYEINAPLWTDGSHKERFVVLPPGERIGVDDDGLLSFPEGSLLLKTFSYAADPFEPDAVLPVETRVMIRRRHGWEFHTYAWDEDGSEAHLLDASQTRSMATSVEGSPSVVVHTFPSREECGYCHGTGDSAALGPRLDQLARTVGYGDQLGGLDAIGLFEGPLPAVAPMADYRDPEAPAPDRARAYLHANCGHCHRPGGWTPPPLDMDLRWTTTLPSTNLCGVPPQYASTFSADYRVAPGEPSESLIWQRLSSRGQWQMPPLATSVADPHADVVREWIAGLDGCPDH